MVSFGSTVQFAVPHITIRNLNKFYDVQGKQVHALKNINLDIPEGKIFGIIGKSGAGKSSLIRQSYLEFHDARSFASPTSVMILLANQ